MKGLNLTAAQLQRADNHAWRKLSGGSPDRKPRVKRFMGSTSDKKRWVRLMDAELGKFIETPRQPNWQNVRPHWAKKKPITDAQKLLAFAITRRSWPTPPFPLIVTLTRYGPKPMDRDGNIAALKYFQDGVALALMVDDGDRTRIDWRYEQVKTLKTGWYGLRIELSPASPDPRSEGRRTPGSQGHA